VNLILSPQPPMIELQQVEKTFKNTAGVFRVLKGIDLTLTQGEFVAVVGKSGSGKSTLLNMVTGIDHPTGGQVIVNGVNVHNMNESKRSLWRGNNLGIVFQFFQLLPMLTLQENIMLPMDFVKKYDFDERPKRAMELLKMVGLEKQAHKLPAAVSTGQQPGRWPPTRLSSRRMNPPATSTRVQQKSSSTCSTTWSKMARPSSWSRMTHP
jgi:putative ABC transport system ATP-binding protein